MDTGFELSEGFNAGSIHGQNGWSAAQFGNPEGHVDTVNPAAGTQHLRISYDPQTSSPSDVGAFSPSLRVLPTGPSTTTVDVSISAVGGADYFVSGQSVSQSLRTWEVNFSFLGNIWVADDLGGGLSLVDTGHAWTVGAYKTLTVCDDPVAQTTEYFYDGESIYTQVTRLGGTRVEQIVLLSDNFQLEDNGDFENLSVQPDLSELCLGIPLGACCYNLGTDSSQCLENVTESTCDTFPEPRAFAEGAACSQVFCRIPTVSEWGCVIMALLTLTAGTLLTGNRRTAVSAQRQCAAR